MSTNNKYQKYNHKYGDKKHNKKSYHPTKKNKNFTPKNHHNNKMKPPAVKNDFFGCNLAANMNFGGSDHDLSGYVKREMILEDQYGNKQTAREKQFFNSGKNIGKVRIRDEDETDF